MNNIIGEILPAAMLIGGLGLLMGAGLGYADRRFAVKEDETFALILSHLPGVNCGVCGYTGCEQLAEAVAKGSAPVTACPLGGTVCAANIAAVLGQDAANVEQMTAYVKCGGGTSQAEVLYEYQGTPSCIAAALLSGGGFKSCKSGCLGFGSCVKSCPVNAIYIIDELAVIDELACTSCGNCVDACPRGLIELVLQGGCRVMCQSPDDGKTVRKTCKKGCIACKICEKACVYGAIKMLNNLPQIDRRKCRLCGKCEEKCPVKAIYLPQKHTKT